MGFNPGMLQPSLLNRNLVPRLQAQRGLQKRLYKRIIVEGENLDNWSGGNLRPPM
jgi:hypothetical protein